MSHQFVLTRKRQKHVHIGKRHYSTSLMHKMLTTNSKHYTKRFSEAMTRNIISQHPYLKYRRQCFTIMYKFRRYIFTTTENAITTTPMIGCGTQRQRRICHNTKACDKVQCMTRKKSTNERVMNQNSSLR